MGAFFLFLHFPASLWTTKSKALQSLLEYVNIKTATNPKKKRKVKFDNNYREPNADILIDNIDMQWDQIKYCIWV